MTQCDRARSPYREAAGMSERETQRGAREMRIGVYTFSTDRDMPPGRLAAEVEARGFTELMFTEHSHIPVARETPYPEVYGGGVLPDFYHRTYDPFVASSFPAPPTPTLHVAPRICLP